MRHPRSATIGEANCFIDVMNTQQVMVYGTLRRVEDAEAKEHRPKKELG